MGFPAAPVDPQLVATHPLAIKLTSLVLFDGTTDLPRNLVTNSLPRVWAGTGGFNSGPAPIYRPTDFDLDATPSAMLRFASNSKSLAYPGAGVNQSNASDTANPDVTHFGIISIDAVDASASVDPVTVPIFGNSQGVYGATGTDSDQEEGLSIWLPGGGNGSSTAFLVWNWRGLIYRNCDSSGANNLCPVLAGHKYLVAVSVGGVYGIGACRFFLYDLGTSTQISPSGSQAFTDGSHGVYNDARYGDWIPNSLGLHYSEQTIFSGGGGVVRMRLAGMDGRMWTDAIGQAWAANPYAMLSATKVTGGSPPTSLISTALGTGTYTGGPLTANGSTTTGAFPISLVYLGDSVISRVTESSVTVVASAPLGVGAVDSYKLYGGTTSPPSLTGTPLATGTVPSLTYSPPDGGLRFYQATATVGSTVYAYPILPATLRTRPAVPIIKIGNSINTGVGSINSALVVAGAVANTAGFDLTISTHAYPGQYGVEYISESNVHSFFGPTTPAGAAITKPRDYTLARCAQEFAATGQKVIVAAQLAGNSSNITSDQYVQICNLLLSGTGQQANYTPSIAEVHLEAPLLQIGGHSADENTALITSATTNSITAAATNPTQIKVTGLGAQAASIAYPSSEKGGHPDPFIAMAEGYDTVRPFIPVVTTPAPPVVASTLLLILPPTATIGVATSAVVALLGGTAPTTATTVTLTCTGLTSPPATVTIPANALETVFNLAPSASSYTVAATGSGLTASGTTTGTATVAATALPPSVVKLNTAYVTPDGVAHSGLFDPVTGQYTNLNPAQVLVGGTWTFAGTVYNGSATTGGALTTAQAAAIAQIPTILADVTTLMTELSGGVVLTSTGLDQITVEAGINARQALSPILAACAGAVAGAGSGVVNIKGAGTTITRISATTDSFGNRIDPTLNLPS